MTVPMNRRLPSSLAVYGLTREDYDQLLRWQGNRCATCRKRFSRLRPACVDHDHRTGEIYGLLCSPCNLDVLGRTRNPEFYIRVAAYLADPPARQLDGAPRRHRDAPPDSLTPPDPA